MIFFIYILQYKSTTKDESGWDEKRERESCIYFYYSFIYWINFDDAITIANKERDEQDPLYLAKFLSLDSNINLKPASSSPVEASSSSHRRQWNDKMQINNGLE